MAILDRRTALAGGFAAVAALPLLAKPGAAQGTGSAPQGGGWYGFKLGDFRCAVISDGALLGDQPIAGTFAIDAPPEEVAAVAAERFLDPSRFSVGLNALYVDTGRNKVLIDTGSADKFTPTSGRLAANMRAAGIDPAGIDTVVISHAHGDHIFGVLDPAGGPVYPNARYVVAEAESAFWTGPADMGRSPLPAEMRQQATEGARSCLGTIRPKTEFVAAGTEIVPGLTSVATPGHTPGHLSFVLGSGGSSLFVPVDVAHHVATALSHPAWKVAFDTDPDVAAATRAQVLDRLATDRVATLFYHFPFPGLGHVARRPIGFGFESVTWSWDPQAELG